MWYHDASFSPSVDRHPGSPESCPNKRDLHIKISESGKEIRTRPLTRTSARWHNGCGVGEQYVWFYVVELLETSTVLSKPAAYSLSIVCSSTCPQARQSTNTIHAMKRTSQTSCKDVCKAPSWTARPMLMPSRPSGCKDHQIHNTSKYKVQGPRTAGEPVTQILSAHQGVSSTPLL